MDDSPIKCLDITESTEVESLDALIPRRKKSIEEPKESNGVVPNGIDVTASIPISNGKPSTKRTASEGAHEGSPLTKRPKTISNGTTNANNASIADDAPILVEDSANGAIVIDDD